MISKARNITGKIILAVLLLGVFIYFGLKLVPVGDPYADGSGPTKEQAEMLRRSAK
jgi:hypothetical protein